MLYAEAQTVILWVLDFVILDAAAFILERTFAKRTANSSRLKFNSTFGITVSLSVKR